MKKSDVEKVMKLTKLEKEVKCNITGFKGVATTMVLHMNGCVQYGVQPEMKEGDNKRPETCYIDTNQLEVVGCIASEAKSEKAEEPTGGEFDNIPVSSIMGL
jgi:hypothetical protein